MNIKKPILILNKSWTPIRVKTVETSIKLVWRKRAVFVDAKDYSVYNWEEWILLPIEENELYIQTPKIRVKLPEVIVLTEYNKIPSYDVRLTRRNIFVRDNFTCQYTNKKVNYNNADIDHIIPKSKGGRDKWDNLVVASKEINRKKGNKTNEETGLKLIKKPKKPDYKSLIIDPRINIPESWKKFIKI